MKEIRLILVGGFLGAGKTSLLWEAAQAFIRSGLRVGMITNDQAPELVDTGFLARGGGQVAEVSGSCFCCNFGGLTDAVAELRRNADVDILIAEPVGSCTDLSATIIQPLKDKMKGEIRLSPLSVLVDATKLDEILQNSDTALHPSAVYILQKQMEEADIILVSKSDLVSPSELEGMKQRLKTQYPEKTVIGLSVKTGLGFQEWHTAVTTRTDSGRSIARIDYDVYAEGEAILGWLNATVRLDGELTEWRSYAESLLTKLGQRFDSTDSPVGHVKLMLTSGEDFVMGNLTGKSDTLTMRGMEFISSSARLTLNARVQMPPQTLDDIAREALDRAGKDSVTWTSLAWECFSPGRPNPTHRYDYLVPSDE